MPEPQPRESTYEGICICGHDREAHDVRNGYCPLKLNAKYTPAALGMPRMALREDPHGLDDVVVEHPTMFRAEMMSEGELWMCCYFPEPHDRIAFWVTAEKKGVLRFSYTEEPKQWVDIDKERRDAA